MTLARPVAGVVALAAVAFLYACAPKRAKAPDRGPVDLVVLLPDPDAKPDGRATVSNPSGKVELSAARDATRVSRLQPPEPAKPLSEDDVARLFGDVMAALPPAPERFTLHYRFESDELTDEGRALVPAILEAVKTRPAPEIVIIGHTDTMGARANNVELGLKRATMVRTLLVDAGLDPSVIELTSHGEMDPLIPTADQTAEPRNRRVEITIR
jgi:OmpA-OmpF porin, OOP family